MLGLLPSRFHHSACDRGAPRPIENLVVPGWGCVSACSIECGTRPPPEQVSHDDHPGSCSMLEIVTEFGFGACSPAEVEWGAPGAKDEELDVRSPRMKSKATLHDQIVLGSRILVRRTNGGGQTSTTNRGISWILICGYRGCSLKPSWCAAFRIRSSRLRISNPCNELDSA